MAEQKDSATPLATPTYMPTPTQAENDLAAIGQVPPIKDYDGSPIDPSSNNPVDPRSTRRTAHHVDRTNDRRAAERADHRHRERH